MIKTTVKELVAVLDIVRAGLPAGSSMRMVPIVHTFYLTDSGMCYSYDDVLLAMAPLPAGAAVKLKSTAVSRILWDLISGFPSDKEVVLERVPKAGMRLQVGRMRADIPSLPEKDFLLSEEDAVLFDKKPLVKVSFKALEMHEASSGLAFCIDCFSFNPAVPEQSGIVMRVAGKAVTFYATDNVSLTKFRVPSDTAVPDPLQCVVPPRFFTELVRLRGLLTDKQWENGTLSMSKTVVAARFGKILLASKVKPLDAVDMDAVFTKHRAKESDESKVTDAVVAAATRAQLILGDAGGVVKISPVSPKGALLEAAVDGVGKVSEKCSTLKVASEFSVDGAKFLRAVMKCSTMMESKTALIFQTPGGIVHLLSKTEQ